MTAAGGNTYSYDLNGNQVQRYIGGITYTLTYNAENCLVGISSVGLTASYTYDGDGQRVKSSVEDGEVTHTTGYVGDYFQIALGTPIEPLAGDPPDCGVNYCLYFPMVLGEMSAPAGEAWVSYYYAGSQRVAERGQSNMQERESGLFYFLTDHLAPSGPRWMLRDAGQAASRIRQNTPEANIALLREQHDHDSG